MEAPSIKRYRRQSRWDYSNGASFFITLTTSPRRPVFGRIVCGKVELSELGKVAAKALKEMPRRNPGLSLYGQVLMPDHIHFNCHLAAGLPEPLQTLGNAIRRFKNHVTKEWKVGQTQFGHHYCSAPACPPSNDGQATSMDDYPNSRTMPSNDGQAELGLSTLWRPGYHDHLCPTRAKIAATERYIAYNPLKWQLMYGERGGMRILEPLSSPRLSAADYWKGVGSPALLDAAERLVSLRVSREVADFAPVVARMRSAAEHGWTVISGFISKGEQAVRDALCAMPGAKLIKIRPSCIPNAKYKPESVYVEAFAQARMLEIARGNDEVEFGRSACLDLNQEIVEIATSIGEGLALYWRKDGAHVIARSGRG